MTATQQQHACSVLDEHVYLHTVSVGPHARQAGHDELLVG